MNARKTAIGYKNKVKEAKVGKGDREDREAPASQSPSSGDQLVMKQEPTKNNLVVLGKRPPYCYFTPLLTRPLLTGVNMAGFTHRPGFEIKIFQKTNFTKNSPVFAFLPGIQSSKPCSTRLQYPDFTPISAAVPAFTGYFLLKIFLDHRFSSSPCC